MASGVLHTEHSDTRLCKTISKNIEKSVSNFKRNVKPIHNKLYTIWKPCVFRNYSLNN